MSTIIPVHNRAELLREAVASVLAQTYRPIEIIVVDDGSTDDTLRTAERLARDHPLEVRVLHQDNRGAGQAREAGRQAARGEFVQYLDSDDVLLPGKFQLQVAALRAEPECGVAYGYTRYRHANGTTERLPWKGSGEKVETMFPSFLRSRWWDTPNPLYRRSVCEAAGPWTDLRLEEDWEYDCRIASLGTKLSYCEAFVAEVRDHGLDRLGRGRPLDPSRLTHRARAHRLIYEHAIRAGIAIDAPERQHFARELFLLSRQCGAAGLSAESQDLFLLAKAASGPARARKPDFRLYAMSTGLLGWTLTGSLACMSDRFRK